MIEAEIAGPEIVAPSTPDVPPARNVMDALRLSLDVVSQGNRKPAEVTTARSATKRKREAS